MALAGRNQVRIVQIAAEVKECTSEQINLPVHEAISTLAWASTGQILAIGTAEGSVYGFLGSIPIIHDTYLSRVLYLTTLSEVGVHDYNTGSKVNMSLQMEPHFVALGPTHVLAGVNNMVHFHSFAGTTGAPQVCSVKMNSSHTALSWI